MTKYLIAACLLVLPGTARAADPLTIAPDDPKLCYVGRFDHRDPAGPRCEWPASSLTVRIRGTGLTFRLNDQGDDDFQVMVDGRADAVTHPGHQGGDVQRVTVEHLTAGEHQVQIVKRTEAFVGCAQFRGLELPVGTELLPPSRLNRRIEVIGDSISCGYGDEAANEHVHFSPRTENAALAYGAITARAVGAEYVCIAWSGKKMWPNNTIPELYDRTLPTDPTSTWDFQSPPPDVVVINLATNDFAHGNPDEKGWTAAYEAFVRRVRIHYPSALIYLASGTMMTDIWPPANRAVTTLAKYLDRIQSELNASGETRIRLLPFGVQDGAADGIGADYHPSTKTQQKMAAKFVAAIKSDLGWAATTQP